VAVAALAPLVFGYVDLLVLPTVVLTVLVLLELAAVELSSRTGDPRVGWHWCAVAVVGVGAAVSASFAAEPSTVVAVLLALVGLGLLVRPAVATVWGHVEIVWVAAVLTPVLVLIAAGWAADWAGLSGGATAAVAVPAVLGLSLSGMPLGWLRAVRGRAARWALFGSAVGVAVIAVAVWGARDGDTAALVTLIIAAVAVTAIGERAPELALAGAGGLAAAWLGFGEVVGRPEVYALPPALAVLAFGGWTWFRDRSVDPVLAFGPGLSTGLVPVTGVAVYDDASARGLAAAVAWSVFAVVVARWGRPASARTAAVAAPALTAVAVGVGAALAGLDRGWIASVALAGMLWWVIVAVVAGWSRAVPRPARWESYLAALVCAVPILGWGAVTPSWLAVLLSVLAAGTAIVSIMERNSWIGALGSLFALSALWVRLADTEVSVPEAYTLPLAVVVLAFGGWAMWRLPRTRSAATIGPGLTLGLATSFVLALDEPYTSRGLLVAVACLLLVAIGAARRWQAPFVLGAGAGLVLVVVGIEPYLRHASPTVLAIASGAVLLAAGINWERLARAGRWSWTAIAELR
jgi:hypothetical protein